MTAGAKPYTMKVVRTVFNGGHEETYGNATRLVPTQQVNETLPLLDHLIRQEEQRWRHRDPQCPRCLEVDHQLELSRLGNRHAAGLAPLRTQPRSRTGNHFFTGA